MKSANLNNLEKTHTIVQCPKCQTKFAIESQNLVGIEAPKFHCSRCDSVFTSDNITAINHTSASARSALLVDKSKDTGALSYSAEEAEAASKDAVTKVPQGFSIRTASTRTDSINTMQPNVTDPAVNNIDAERLGHESETAADWTTPVPSEAAPAMTGAALKISRTPSSSPQTAQQFQTQSFQTQSFQTQPLQTHSTQAQMQFDFSSGSLARQAAPKTQAQLEPAANFQAPTQQIKIPPPPPSAETSRWTGFSMLAIPLVFFMSAIFGISYYLRQNAVDAESLLEAMASSLPQVAPVELALDEVNFKKVTLDSGEAIFLVSGKITNDSNLAFDEVKLEGVGFGQNGEPVARTVVDSGATLNKTRVNSLTPSMIKDLQSGKIKTKQSLKPEQSRDFVFAFTDGEPQNARYFTARVYSVKH